MPLRDAWLRLLADDLTGALDSAAAFASVSAPVPVCWRGAVPSTGPVAWDSGTREASPEAARAALDAVALDVMHAGAGLRFKKIDSLLRGHEADEIAVLLARLAPAHCLIAPAFPAQGRITRSGRQHVCSPSGLHPVPSDLGRALMDRAVPLALARPGDVVPPGVSLWDADDDADLDAIVAGAVDLPDVLWVGSAGLSAALARAVQCAPAWTATTLPRPLLGLVGSDHKVTQTQLARLGRHHVSIDPGACGSNVAVAERLAADGAVFATVALPSNVPRSEAAAAIRSCFERLLDRLAPPGTLVASGGETLRSLCEALQADRLEVLGALLPGVPCSRLCGGRWDGVAVISKSGAFGDPDLFAHLVAGVRATTAGAAT